MPRSQGSVSRQFEPQLPADLPVDLLNQWETAEGDAAKALAVLQMAYFAEDSSKRQAGELARVALNYALRADEPEVTVKVLLSLAFVVTAETRTAEALQLIQQAMMLTEEMGEAGRPLFLDAVNARATLRMNLGDVRGARTDFQYTLSQAEESRDLVATLLAHVNLAWVYILVEQFDAALHSTLLADEVYSELVRTPDALHTRQKTYYRLAVLETTTTALLKSALKMKKAGRELKVPELVARAKRNVQEAGALLDERELQPRMLFAAHQANIYLLEGDIAAAQEAANLSYALSEQIGPTSYTQAQQVLAAVYSAQHNWQAAQQALHQSLNTVRKVNNTLVMTQILEKLAHSYEASGDFQHALMYSKEAFEYATAMLHNLEDMDDLAVFSRVQAPQAPLQVALSWRERLLIAEQQAHHDHLTGVLNRRGFEAGLNLPEWRALGQRHPLALAVIDIDFFKNVNDEYSHVVGDEVLRVMAQLLVKSLPSTALLARYGGEEFLTVFPAKSRRSAWQSLEHCRQSVAGYDWSALIGSHTLTVSIGYVLSSEANLPAAYAQADEQLYHAKQAGRNQVFPKPDADGP